MMRCVMMFHAYAGESLYQAWRAVAAANQSHFVSVSLVIDGVRTNPRGVYTAEHARSGLRVQAGIVGHHLQDSKGEKCYWVQCQRKPVQYSARPAFSKSPAIALSQRAD